MLGFSIGQVVLSTGLSARQIRYCEEKGYIQPERTSGGHRLYSDKDVSRLLRLAGLRRKGKSLKQALLILQNDYIPSIKQPEQAAVRQFFELPPREQRL